MTVKAIFWDEHHEYVNSNKTPSALTCTQRALLHLSMSEEPLWDTPRDGGREGEGETLSNEYGISDSEGQIMGLAFN